MDPFFNLYLNDSLNGVSERFPMLVPAPFRRPHRQRQGRKRPDSNTHHHPRPLAEAEPPLRTESFDWFDSAHHKSAQDKGGEGQAEQEPDCSEKAAVVNLGRVKEVMEMSRNLRERGGGEHGQRRERE